MKKPLLRDEELTAYKKLIKKYKNTPHPLKFANLYQLMVMVVLSAQSTDQLVNNIAPGLFERYPNFKSLANTDIETLIPYISKIRSFRKKGEWLIRIASLTGDEKKIPLTMKDLTDLPGIGRKSANVIMREAGVQPEGVIVDLHVIRVAGRIGITRHEEAKKIEDDIRKKLPQDLWGDVGMCLSFLGREICRPTDPHHSKCVMNDVCSYYKKLQKKNASKA